MLCIHFLIGPDKKGVTLFFVEQISVLWNKFGARLRASEESVGPEAPPCENDGLSAFPHSRLTPPPCAVCRRLPSALGIPASQQTPDLQLRPTNRTTHTTSFTTKKLCKHAAR